MVTATPVVSTETAVHKVALLDGKIKKFKVDSLSDCHDFYSKANEKVENLSTYTIHYKDLLF